MAFLRWLPGYGCGLTRPT